MYLKENMLSNWNKLSKEVVRNFFPIYNLVFFFIISNCTIIYPTTEPLSCYSYQIFCPYIQEKVWKVFFETAPYQCGKEVKLQSFVRETFSPLYTAWPSPGHQWAIFPVDVDVTLPMHRWGQASAWHHLHHHSLLTHLSTPLQSAPLVTLFLNLLHFHSSCWIMRLLCIIWNVLWHKSLYWSLIRYVSCIETAVKTYTLWNGNDCQALFIGNAIYFMVHLMQASKGRDWASLKGMKQRDQSGAD